MCCIVPLFAAEGAGSKIAESQPASSKPLNRWTNYAIYSASISDQSISVHPSKVGYVSVILTLQLLAAFTQGVE